MFDLGKIKERREELGLTQAELAGRAKITIACLSRIENGHTRYILPDTYTKLAKALRIEEAELLK